MLSLTPFLFPSSPDLLLEQLTCSGQTLFLTVRSSRRTGSCPDCAVSAEKVHSQYVRTLADVPLMEYAVQLHVQVRRFFCCNPACGRKTFAEQFPDLTPTYARRTHRQIGRLRAIAKELGGRPGARESTNVCIPVSRHTHLAFGGSCSHSSGSRPPCAWGRRLGSTSRTNVWNDPGRFGAAPCGRSAAGSAGRNLCRVATGASRGRSHQS